MEHFPLYVLCLSYIEGQVWNMTIYAFREEKSLMMYSEVSLIVRSSKSGYWWAKEYKCGSLATPHAPLSHRTGLKWNG